MTFNKKGSLAFNFIYGLGFLFGLGILYIVFNQVIQVDYQPTIEGMIDDESPNKAMIEQMNSEWISYWEIIPILLVLTVMLYFFVSGIMQQ